jgi:hypothetical protein
VYLLLQYMCIIVITLTIDSTKFSRLLNLVPTGMGRQVEGTHSMGWGGSHRECNSVYLNLGTSVYTHASKSTPRTTY